MTARVLDGKALATHIRATLSLQVLQLKEKNVFPGLAVVLVGNHPASQVYVKNKTKACQEVGIRVFDYTFPENVETTVLLQLIQQLNQDAQIHGVLIQLPLPSHILTPVVLDALDPSKDVDGLLAHNIGRLWQGVPRFAPCTPLGVMRLLQEAQTTVAGANAVVLGRSQLVGRPMAALLLNANATTIICHSQTKHLPEFVQKADILIAAIGQPAFVQGAWIKKGATVIDVGINRLPNGKLVGDVEFEAAVQHAAVVTPVPGGVGPMTIAMLLHNTVLAATP